MSNEITGPSCSEAIAGQVRPSPEFVQQPEEVAIGLGASSVAQIVTIDTCGIAEAYRGIITP